MHFRGHVDGEAKRAAFTSADLFVFATHSENFGMVVAEALAHGVPAIVSHGAPWPELDSKGCGRWVLMGMLFVSCLVPSMGVGPLTGLLDRAPRSPSVGVVRIDGEIGADHAASAHAVIAALDRACQSLMVNAVVLSIDSPGGAPVEAERINQALAALKAKHGKPVVAVIQGIGASAAYMVAMHADQVYAGKYSLVGSIGAVMTAWDGHEALARLNVRQRTYTSGPLKAMLNPYEAPNERGHAKARALVNQVGQAFATEVRERRARTLQPGFDVATGEEWGGLEAKSLGLVAAARIGALPPPPPAASSRWRCLGSDPASASVA